MFTVPSQYKKKNESKSRRILVETYNDNGAIGTERSAGGDRRIGRHARSGEK